MLFSGSGQFFGCLVPCFNFCCRNKPKMRQSIPDLESSAPSLSNAQRWNQFIAPVLLSSTELSKLFAMSLIVSPFFGLPGIFFLFCMHILSIQTVGADSADKHGISSVSSSRLGGVSIAIMMCAYVGFTFATSIEPLALNATEQLGLIAVMSMAFLGLTEDLRPDCLSPLLRLAAQVVFMGGVLLASQSYIPDSLGLPLVDYLLGFPLASWILCTIFAVGFVNAVNMADGANGLIPGISFAAFFVFASETGRMFEVGYMSACAIFLVFNVISGRFFLGDMGSYGLGAAVALYGLWFVSQGTLSAAFLACLLAYPCLDLLMSIFRRLKEGRSPFSPDNEHLHNRLFRQLKKVIKIPVLANSMTGLLISCATSGVAVIGYVGQWWPPSGNQWGYLFGFECLLYISVFYLTGIRRRSPLPSVEG